MTNLNNRFECVICGAGLKDGEGFYCGGIECEGEVMAHLALYLNKALKRANLKFNLNHELTSYRQGEDRADYLYQVEATVDYMMSGYIQESDIEITDDCDLFQICKAWIKDTQENCPGFLISRD
jgi:hypothetical protein